MMIQCIHFFLLLKSKMQSHLQGNWLNLKTVLTLMTQPVSPDHVCSVVMEIFRKERTVTLIAFSTFSDEPVTAWWKKKLVSGCLVGIVTQPYSRLKWIFTSEALNNKYWVIWLEGIRKVNENQWEHESFNLNELDWFSDSTCKIHMHNWNFVHLSVKVVSLVSTPPA